MSESATFAVLYVRGPNWDERVPFHEQDGVSRHREFLAAQHAAGSLIIGGPFLDDMGGLAVYRADSREELDRTLAGDATVISGLLRYEIHPYMIGFREQ